MTDLENFRAGLRAYDDGVAQVWRMLNDLVRAGVDDATLRSVIVQHAPVDVRKRQPVRPS